MWHAKLKHHDYEESAARHVPVVRQKKHVPLHRSNTAEVAKTRLAKHELLVGAYHCPDLNLHFTCLPSSEGHLGHRTGNLH